MTSLRTLAEARRLAALADALPLKSYREILHRWDDPQPGDVERLAEVLVALGLTDDDVAVDLDELVAIRALEDTVADAESAVNALPDTQALDAELDQVDRALAAQIHPLLEPKRELVAQRKARIEAERRLRTVRTSLADEQQQCDRLFGD